MSAQPPHGPTSSPLAAAYDELRARLRAADDAGDWREHSILSPLASVAGFVKRIGDHTDSTHYRADKASDLVEAAHSLQLEALLAYAGWPDGDATERELLDANDTLTAVTRAVVSVMWSRARRDPLCPYQAQALRDAAQRVTRFSSACPPTVGRE